MSQVIRMEVEAVERTLSTLRSLLRQGRGLEDELRRAARALPFAWQGPSAEHFTQDLHGAARRYEQLLSELEQLTQALEQEKEEWLATDAAFGEGKDAVGTSASTNNARPRGSSIPVPEWVKDLCRDRTNERILCETIWKRLPRNAGDVAYMIQTLPEDAPIGIFNMGNGEVLILLRGTKVLSLIQSNDFESAMESMFWGENSYQISVLLAVQDAIRRGIIPPGSKIHIAGHSQGGMVAQNLAVDPRFLRMLEANDIKVESVTTFGSPDTFASVNPEVKYIMFEHENDLVPKIDEALEKILPGSMDSRLSDVEAVAEQYVLRAPAKGRLEAHNYRRLDVLAELNKYSLPFTTQEMHAWSENAFAFYSAYSADTPFFRVVGVVQR